MYSPVIHKAFLIQLCVLMCLGAMQAQPSTAVDPGPHQAADLQNAAAPVRGALLAGPAPELDLMDAAAAPACISPAQRKDLMQHLDQAARALRQTFAEKAPTAPSQAADLRSARMLFRHPMVWKDSLEGFYHAGVLTAYADHNPHSGSLDYACGARSYDGHSGTDFMPFPFSWWSMDQNMAQVVAAAPGKILYKEDGHFDRQCHAPDSSWNAVYLLHADGSTSWYGHLKSGSLTAKAVGEAVAAGEYLGIAGSSGRSTGPHLHFEVHDSLGNWIDPFQGGCGNAGHSWWSEQRPYRDTRIAAVGFHPDVPTWIGCADPGENTVEWRSTFHHGEDAFIGVYLQDPFAGLALDIRVLDPLGRVATIYRHDFAGSSQAGYALFALDLAHSMEFGTWNVEIRLDDEVYERQFDYCYDDLVCTCPTPTGTMALYQGDAAYGLYWNAVDEALLYRVQVQGRGDNNREVASTNADWIGLERGETYRWRVRSMCGPFGSRWTDWKPFTVPLWDVRPVAETDPTLRAAAPLRYAVYSAIGQLLWSGTAAPDAARLEQLGPGGTLYLFEHGPGGTRKRMILR